MVFGVATVNYAKGFTLQQSLWEADQWVSHLNRGLAKAHSSAVDGDGATSNAMWTQWTPALSDQITLDLSVHMLAADQMTVAYGVTPDKINATVQNGQLPLCVTTTSPWNQQTPDKKEILLLLGCQCPNCGALLPGDVNNNTEPEAVCALCGEPVTLVRTWIAKSNHPLIRAAQQQMDMQSRLDTLVVKKLSFADVSPVKGGSSEKHGRLLAESMIGTVVVCQCGAVQAPLTTVARQCTVCQHWLQFGSVEITVRSDLILDPAVRQSLNFRNPTLQQLILASMTLTLDQQAAQEQSKLISQFPQYPLATADQVTAARGSGLLMTSATPPIKFFKPMLDALLGLTTRIGTGSGDFEVLDYLTNKSATSRQERFRQQKGLVACLRQGKLLDLWEAILSGKLILVEDEKETKGGTSAMATEAVSILVKSLLEAPGQFGKCRITELHEVLTERANRGTSSVLVIDPRILEQLDEALFKLLRKFVPTSFFQGLEDKFWDLKQCRVSSISFLMLILGEDKHSEAIEAKDTRQYLDSVLSTAWKQAETAAEFRRRYEENLAKYHAFSSIPRYPAGLEGQREQIEHLLTLFKKGALKTAVMNKWENSKLKAELAQHPEPGLEDFWRMVQFQYSIIEAKDAREVASRAPPTEDKSKGKRTLDESINSIGVDADPRACRNFTQNGRCTRGADCPYAHDPAFKKQQVSDTPDTSKPDGKGKGVKGKGGKGKGFKGGKLGKGNSSSRPGKGATRTNNEGAFDPAIPHWCSRCNEEHKGQVSRWCVFAPCRFCEETGSTPTNHSLRSCTLKSDGYQFVPGEHSPPTDKGGKTDKVTVGDMISSWNKTQLAAVKDTINAIDAEMVIGVDETPNEEQISTLKVTPVSGTRTVTFAPLADQQLVPYAAPAASSTIVAVRRNPPISQEQQLKTAIQKITAVPGSHQVLVTLTQVDAEPKRAVPKRLPQLFQGKSRRLTDKDEDPSTLMLICEDVTLDAMLGPQLPCCSETLVRQKEVSKFSIIGHKLQPSSADGVAMSKLVSESASALTDESERSHNNQSQVVPLPKAAAGNKVNPYLAMMRVPLAAHNEFTALTGGRIFRAHDYLIHDEVLGDIEPDLSELNELAAVNELTLPLIDSGATNGKLLRDGGANLNSDGVEDPDYFNPEVSLPQIITIHQVSTISIQPQRSLGSGTADSQTVHVPLIDPVPTMEVFGTLSPERYGEAIAELMAKVQMLHLMAASSPINVSKSDPHEAQESIHLALNTLQEIGDDFASTKGKSVPTTAHSVIQLQQSANERDSVYKTTLRSVRSEDGNGRQMRPQ